MLMAEFANCVQYKLPVKIVIVKNNSLGMIKWEQMVFLGNPEYGCELQPSTSPRSPAPAAARASRSRIQRNAAPCSIRPGDRGPRDRRSRVDPFTPPMPPKVTAKQAAKFAQSLVKGQPNRDRSR